MSIRFNHMRAALALSAILLAFLCLNVAPAMAAFGVESFSARAENEDTTATTQAGSHPYQFHLNLKASEADLGEANVSLPPGFLFNPTAIAECPDSNFH